MSDTSSNPLNTASSLDAADVIVEVPLRDGQTPRAEYRQTRNAQRTESRALRYEMRARRRAERSSRPPDLVPLVNFCKNIVDDASEFLAEVADRMEKRNKARERADEDAAADHAGDAPKSKAARKA